MKALSPVLTAGAGALAVLAGVGAAVAPPSAAVAVRAALAPRAAVVVGAAVAPPSAAVAVRAALAPRAAVVVGAAPPPAADAASARLAPPVPVPLPTSVRTRAGTWATVPMGHLGQPLNTFWQLLFLPAGGPTWSDRVEATGVATNGGIVLAAAGKRLVVGVRPSHLLTYSPLIATATSGRSWSTGLVEQGLADAPSALATLAFGQTMALALGAHGATEVLSSRPGASALSSWQVVLSSRRLVSLARATCAPLFATAVGYAGDRPVVGATCAKGGSLGLFYGDGGRWSLATGPRLASGAGVAEVLTLVQTGSRLAAIIASRGQGGFDLVGAWSTDGRTWQTSAYLRVPTGLRIASVGPAQGAGVFALLVSGGGRAEVAVTGGPGAQWRWLPAPPAGTQTVVFGPATEALAVDQSVLDVWRLSGQAWRRAQVLHVPIQYGSSG